MKRLILLLFFVVFIFFPMFSLEAKEVNTEYWSYPEIIMSSGKLLKNFTEKEYEELYNQIDGVHFLEIIIKQANVNVKASYISDVLLSYENRGKTNVELNKTVSIETNQKMSFSTSGNLSVGGAGTLKKVKLEASAKASISYSSSSEESIKEKRDMKIIVEPNSKMIMYLTGDLTISNGVVKIYEFFFNIYSGGYECATINTQYVRLEKETIDTTIQREDANES